MNIRSRFTAIFTISLAAMIAMPLVFYGVTTGEYYGRKIDQVAPDFTLFDTQNIEHSLSQHKGKFTFLYFGYLNCDEVCHNQVGVMFNINHQTTNKDLDFIFVTMDPKRDSKPLLNDYFNQFGSNFYALTAESMREIQSVASKYKAYFSPEGTTKVGKDYEISHPGNIFLIDPNGQIQVIYQNTYLRYDKVIEDLNLLRMKFIESQTTELSPTAKEAL